MSWTHRLYLRAHQPSFLLTVSFAALIFGFFAQRPGLLLPESLVNSPYESRSLVYAYHAPLLDISYFQYGVIRRGLVGTLLSFVHLEARQVVFVFLMVLLLCFCSYVLLCPLLRRHSKVGPLILAAALSPMGFMEIGFLFGSFDLLLLLCGVFGMLAIFRSHWLVGGLLAACGVLVHEAFIFFGFPLILAAIFQVSKAKWKVHAPIGGILASIAPIGVVTVAIYISDDSRLVSIAGFGRGLFQPQLSPFPIMVAVVLVGCCGVTLFLLRSVICNRYRFWLVVPFLTLPLFALGTDQMRWISMIFQSTLVVLIYLSVVSDVDILVILGGSRLGKVAVMLCCVPLLGPIGITTPFPVVEDFIQLVVKLSG